LPAQLFGSAPWWLLHDRPVNEEWDFKDGNPPEATKRSTTPTIVRSFSLFTIIFAGPKSSHMSLKGPFSYAITGELDAIAKYASLSILESLIPRFVNVAYEKGPFKLIPEYLVKHIWR
jgi:hypothetical protein